MVGIYSPSVTVFREPESRGYRLMEESVDMSFVAVPAYARPSTNPPTSKNAEPTLTDKMAQNTLKKIQLILWIALHNGHHSLVLR